MCIQPVGVTAKSQKAEYGFILCTLKSVLLNAKVSVKSATNQVQNYCWIISMPITAPFATASLTLLEAKEHEILGYMPTKLCFLCYLIPTGHNCRDTGFFWGEGKAETNSYVLCNLLV